MTKAGSRPAPRDCSLSARTAEAYPRRNQMMAFGTNLTSISAWQAVKKDRNHDHNMASSSKRKDVLIGILLDFVVGQAKK
jgi:hypothetical protein